MNGWMDIIHGRFNTLCITIDVKSAYFFSFFQRRFHDEGFALYGGF